MRTELLALARRLEAVDAQLAEGRPHAAAETVCRAREAARQLADELLDSENALPPLAQEPLALVDELQDGMRAEWQAVWRELDWAFEERFVGADGRVVTFVRQAGSPRRGWPRAEVTCAIVSTLGDGCVVCDEVFESWRDALTAVGGAAAATPVLERVA